MKLLRIFELNKREQRVIILLVIVLVTIAFARHWFQTRSSPPRTSSQSLPTASPMVLHEKDETNSDERH